MKIYSIETSEYDQNHVLVKRNKLRPSSPEPSKEAYIVSSNKKDEFVRKLEKKEAKIAALSCLVWGVGTAIGMFAGYKFPVTRADAKAWSLGYGAVAGTLLGLLGSGLINNHYTNKLLKDFNAEKYSGDKKAC